MRYTTNPADVQDQQKLADLLPAEAETHYLRAEVDGVEMFYREAGPHDAPVLLLLHGFPSSSRMFRELIPWLSDNYRVIAPDYPGFGHSGVPGRSDFSYTFDHIAELIDKLLDQLGVRQFTIYVMDFGGPVGYRLALWHPDRLSAIVVQNAPLYPEEPSGWWATLGQYWADGSAEHRDAARAYLELNDIRGQYIRGVPDPSRVDPDNWVIDKALIDRPGVDEIRAADPGRSSSGRISRARHRALRARRQVGPNRRTDAGLPKAQHPSGSDQELGERFQRCPCPALVQRGKHQPVGSDEALIVCE